MKTTVGRHNEVKLPAELVSELAIKPGTVLEWYRGSERGVFTVKVPANREILAQSLLGAGRKYLAPGQDPIADLIAEREREGRERDAAL